MADREYAVYSLAGGDKQVLAEMVKDYGTPGADIGDGSFEAAKGALVKPCSHACDGTGNCLGFAAHDTKGHLVPWRFQRRPVGPSDIRLQITHCGICHSDLHQIRGEWGNSSYPMVPGHELIGVVTEVGADVKKFKVGDHAGVGCMVDSCGTCAQCAAGEEQYCIKGGPVWTYNSKLEDGSLTQGGYSTHYVVRESFAVLVPKSLPLEGAAPLLCAGITTYSPMKFFGLDKPGMSVGVVGLGGLGHMVVKWARAFGMTVTVISTSPNKKEEACSRLGADSFVVSRDPEDMKAAAGSLDGIIDTVSAEHELAPYLTLLKASGKFVVVGLPSAPFAIGAGAIVSRRLTVAGSMIGGIRETQEMMDFAAEHGVVCDTELIPIDYVNTAMERMHKGDVRYRFVLDIAKTLVA